MIVAMKKMSVVVLSGQTRQATDDLQDLGLLHVNLSPAPGGDLEQLRHKEALARRALGILKEIKDSKKSADLAQIEAAHDFESVVARVVETGERMGNLLDENDRARKELERLAMWGEFEPADIRQFKDMGIEFHMIVMSSKEEKLLPENTPRTIIKRVKGKTYLIWLGATADLPRSAEILILPEHSSAQLRDAIAERTGIVRELTAQIMQDKPAIPALEDGLKELAQMIEFASVEATMTTDGALSVITGFIPIDAIDDAKRWAGERGWAIMLRDPEPDDPVPTKLHNPRPIRLLRPILDFLGTFPGYTERDISPYFLLFLTIFLSMIISDGAYGTILLLTALFMAIKVKAGKKKLPPFIPLLAVFSVATIAWGAVTGTWFGLEQIAQLPVLRDLIIQPIYSFNSESTPNVQLICFILGLIHLNLAHLLRFIREIRRAPHIHAFAQIGWALVLNGAFFLVLNLVVSADRYPVPGFATIFIAIGMGLVFIFEQQGTDGFFRGMLRALQNILTTGLNGVSAFADIISYIRLFAVGLAGFAISGSFNGMAQGAMESGDVGGMIGGILILVAGHSLNLMLCVLSVIVHGIRLNLLEFSNHIGLEWAGYAYKPFKRQSV